MPITTTYSPGEDPPPGEYVVATPPISAPTLPPGIMTIAITGVQAVMAPWAPVTVVPKS